MIRHGATEESTVQKKVIRKRIRTACYATVQTANNNLKENNNEMHQKPTRANKQTICSRTSVSKSKNRSKNERKNQIAKTLSKERTKNKRKREEKRGKTTHFSQTHQLTVFVVALTALVPALALSLSLVLHFFGTTLNTLGVWMHLHCNCSTCAEFKHTQMASPRAGHREPMKILHSLADQSHSWPFLHMSHVSLASHLLLVTETWS